MSQSRRVPGGKLNEFEICSAARARLPKDTRSPPRRRCPGPGWCFLETRCAAAAVWRALNGPARSQPHLQGQSRTCQTLGSAPVRPECEYGCRPMALAPAAGAASPPSDYRSRRVHQGLRRWRSWACSTAGGCGRLQGGAQTSIAASKRHPSCSKRSTGRRLTNEQPSRPGERKETRPPALSGVLAVAREAVLPGLVTAAMPPWAQRLGPRRCSVLADQTTPASNGKFRQVHQPRRRRHRTTTTSQWLARSG